MSWGIRFCPQKESLREPIPALSLGSFAVQVLSGIFEYCLEQAISNEASSRLAAEVASQMHATQVRRSIFRIAGPHLRMDIGVYTGITLWPPPKSI